MRNDFAVDDGACDGRSVLVSAGALCRVPWAKPMVAVMRRPTMRTMGDDLFILTSLLSVVALQPWPNGLQIELWSAAEPDRVVLVAPRVGMLHASGSLDRLKMFAVAPAIAVQDDHGTAIILARPPNPVAVVLADSLGQTVPGTVEIDGRRRSPTVAEDRRTRLLLSRQTMIDALHLAHHLFPAKLVGKVLGQGPVILVLGFWRLQA